MHTGSTETHQLFAAVAERLVLESDTTVGLGEKKGFGSSALQIKGKIFAFATPRNEFVVKLPKSRVDALEASDAGQRFHSGNDRIMKEWVVVKTEEYQVLLGLAREAMAFVESKH